MTTMIEQVAKALFESHKRDFIGAAADEEWVGLAEYQREFAYKQARAALEAMRDYTEVMSQAGGAVSQFELAPGRPIGQSAAERCWVTMIAAALQNA